MRWFKHMVASSRDERIAAFISETGLEGYGFWWRILEIIAEQIQKGKEKCSVTYPPREWARQLYCQPRRVRKFLEGLAGRGLLRLDHDAENVRVSIPNLLKYRDEWQNRLGSHSRVTRELRERTQNPETDKEHKPPTVPQGGLGASQDLLKSKKRPEWEPLFARFWEAYPRKVGKGAAEKVFGRIKPETELVNRMLTAIEQQKHTDQWRKDGGRYIPYPATFLNQRRWEDVLNIAPEGTSYSVREDVYAV